jgi:hypothetical protein
MDRFVLGRNRPEKRPVGLLLQSFAKGRQKDFRDNPLRESNAV